MMFSPKILGLKVEMFGTEWIIQNCTKNAKLSGFWTSESQPNSLGRDPVKMTHRPGA